MKYTEITAGYLILSRDGRTHFISPIESNVTDMHGTRIDPELQTSYATWKKTEYVKFYKLWISKQTTLWHWQPFL